MRQWRNLMPRDPVWLAHTEDEIEVEYHALHAWQEARKPRQPGEEQLNVESDFFAAEAAAAGMVFRDGQWQSTDPDDQWVPVDPNDVPAPEGDA